MNTSHRENMNSVMYIILY